MDYSDPEYVVDQGLDDEFADPRLMAKEETEEAIEAMREDRRRRNDEFQFETYFEKVLKNGENYKGEWTVYKVLDSTDLRKARHVMRVISSASKKFVETDSDFRVDGERIVPTERLALPNQDYDLDDFDDDDEIPPSILEIQKKQLEDSIYHPSTELNSYHFRGAAGTMCVGNAYTICNATPIHPSKQDAEKVNNKDENHDGPFRNYRTEIGIQYKRMRFRVKLEYKIENEEDTDAPPLKLDTLIVCRETLERWPRYSAEKTNVDDSAYEPFLFGLPVGAPGGLYDPPPIESQDDYMFLDLDGGASILFPHTLKQDDSDDSPKGYVTSLDWTPGRIRFQADRKINAGIQLKGLKTLELTEVEAETADIWRPKDGGQNMRQ